MYWTTDSGRIELRITKKQAAACSHPGPCDSDVQNLQNIPSIKRQLAKIPADVLEKLPHLPCFLVPFSSFTSGFSIGASRWESSLLWLRSREYSGLLPLISMHRLSFICWLVAW